MRLFIRPIAAVLFAIFLTFPVMQARAQDAGDAGQRARMSDQLLSDNGFLRRIAIHWLADKGGSKAVPALIRALRFETAEAPEIVAALEKVTGAKPGDDWKSWMLWLQQHPEITPHKDYDRFLSAFFAALDPKFVSLIYPSVPHTIRLEEIVWGGVKKDAIPPLDDPALIPASDADYLTPEELVFGIEINGDARAYPLRIMDWHEMLNDVVGGVSVSLAYCTLCGSGILFETALDGREKPFRFGSSGLLYRSNKLMYDRETNSLWNQFTGEPAAGPLAGSGITLLTRPVVITSWQAWRASHPETKVLSLDTGFERDYRPGQPYGDYFASKELIFPAYLDDGRLGAKDYVFALRGGAADKAWPLAAFKGGAVINDMAGAVPLTLIGNEESQTVRAYRTDGRVFEKTGNPGEVRSGGEAWQVTEEALRSPEGEAFPRLPGHIAYWFAWSGYLGAGGELAEAR